jgi:hypothetical protein
MVPDNKTKIILTLVIASSLLTFLKSNNQENNGLNIHPKKVSNPASNIRDAVAKNP